MRLHGSLVTLVAIGLLSAPLAGCLESEDTVESTDEDNHTISDDSDGTPGDEGEPVDDPSNTSADPQPPPLRVYKLSIRSGARCPPGQGPVCMQMQTGENASASSRLTGYGIIAPLASGPLQLVVENTDAVEHHLIFEDALGPYAPEDPIPAGAEQTIDIPELSTLPWGGYRVWVDRPSPTPTEPIHVGQILLRPVTTPDTATTLNGTSTAGFRACGGAACVTLPGADPYHTDLEPGTYTLDVIIAWDETPLTQHQRHEVRIVTAESCSGSCQNTTEHTSYAGPSPGVVRSLTIEVDVNQTTLGFEALPATEAGLVLPYASIGRDVHVLGQVHPQG